MYPLTGKWYIQAGKEAEAIIALKKLALDVQKNEPDTLLYMVFIPNHKEHSLPPPPANEVVFFEIYKDIAGFSAHIQGDIFQKFIEEYGDLFVKGFNQNPQIYMTGEILTKVGGFAREGLC